MVKMHTDENGSDMLTKVMPAEKLNAGRQRVGVKGEFVGKHVPLDGKEISSRVKWLTRSRPIPKPKPRSRIDFVTNSGGYNYK